MQIIHLSVIDRERWRRHIDDHIEELDGSKATKCPHPRPECVEAFPSVLEMKVHLQNVHCIEFTKGVKRRRSGSEVETMPARRMRSRQTKDYDPDVKVDMWPQFTYEFVNETTKLYSRHGTRTSTPSISSEQLFLLNTFAKDEVTDATDTPASSICTNIFDKLDLRLHGE